MSVDYPSGSNFCSAQVIHRRPFNKDVEDGALTVDAWERGVNIDCGPVSIFLTHAECRWLSSRLNAVVSEQATGEE